MIPKKDLICRIRFKRLGRQYASGPKAGNRRSVKEAWASTSGYMSKTIDELRWILFQEIMCEVINDLFPPTNEKWPVAFIRNDELNLIVTSECTTWDTIGGEKYERTVCDYYANSYIDSRLIKLAEDHGCYWEWENPACITLAMD